MSEGTRTYQGLAVPLLGECEITQQTAATDILSVTGAASQTGDFLVLQNSSGTELNVIDANGDINLYKTSQAAFGRLNLPILSTAPASAGLTKGDLWLAKATTDVYRLALCISTAGAATRYGTRMHLATIGAST